MSTMSALQNTYFLCFFLNSNYSNFFIFSDGRSHIKKLLNLSNKHVFQVILSSCSRRAKKKTFVEHSAKMLNSLLNVLIYIYIYIFSSKIVYCVCLNVQWQDHTIYHSHILGLLYIHTTTTKWHSLVPRSLQILQLNLIFKVYYNVRNIMIFIF